MTPKSKSKATGDSRDLQELRQQTCTGCPVRYGGNLNDKFVPKKTKCQRCVRSAHRSVYYCTLCRMRYCMDGLGDLPKEKKKKDGKDDRNALVRALGEVPKSAELEKT
eukprot:Awhi_evm1s11060